MNVGYWLSNLVAAPLLPKVHNPDKIEENYVFIETEESIRADVSRLKEKLPQFPVHRIVRSASMCCISDAALQIQNLVAKVPNPVSQSKYFGEEGPYTLAFWSQVKKSDRQFFKSLYFINSTILASRGSMRAMEKIKLLSGDFLSCNSQVFKDLKRWGGNTYFILDGELHSLEALQQSKLTIGVNANRNVSFKMVGFLDSIHDQFRSDDIFSLFTRYLHQGPFNDMVYSMMADALEQWNISFIPDQKGMSRTFNLTEDRKNKVYKLIISVKGYFIGGYIPDVGTIEPNSDKKLASFYGVTIVNLKTGAAFVRTYVDVFRDKWIV